MASNESLRKFKSERYFCKHLSNKLLQQYKEWAFAICAFGGRFPVLARGWGAGVLDSAVSDNRDVP